MSDDRLTVKQRADNNAAHAALPNVASTALSQPPVIFFLLIFKTHFMKLMQRLKAPLPVFYRKIRTGGMVAAAIGTSLLTATNLPPVLQQAGGWLVAAGSVAAVVCQTTVSPRRKTKKEVNHGRKRPFER
ncbi:MAG: hypothetical protein JWP69_2198 [Flaviaesturariibacter sp.]|nr:hypothetical protein [Flaviaesturariibacter sp.]